jgi:hypothetical protein
MSFSEEAATFNNLFVERMSTQEGMDKTAAAGQAYVRSFLRENAFSRKIIPPESLTRADLQRSTKHDTLIKIVDFEHPSSAAAINFRSAGRERYLQGKRYAIPFFKVESDLFTKNEAELLAYEYPITKVIEENSIKDIMFVEDKVFLDAVNGAVNTSGKRIASASTKVDRSNLNNLFKMIDVDKLQSATVLMTNVDFDDWQTQQATDVGSAIAGELVVSGYKYEQIMRRKLVVTNKTDLLAPGHIFAFTDPGYLGHFFILNDVKFWIKKEADKIFWKTWEHVGMGIANLRSVSKIELDVPNFATVFGTPVSGT